MIRLAAIGTASTGKSAVLNALFGTAFPVDSRAGTTRAEQTFTGRFAGHEVEVIDTPPLEQVFTKQSADAYLMVCDKDLTDTEYQQLARLSRPAAVAVNKADRYTGPQMRQLLQQVRTRLSGIVPPERIVACRADPVKIIHRETAGGGLTERAVHLPADIHALLPVVSGLLAEAEASLRVRARTIAAHTRETALAWLREAGDRLRKEM